MWKNDEEGLDRLIMFSLHLTTKELGTNRQVGELQRCLLNLCELDWV